MWYETYKKSQIKNQTSSPLQQRNYHRSSNTALADLLLHQIFFNRGRRWSQRRQQPRARVRGIPFPVTVGHVASPTSGDQVTRGNDSAAEQNSTHVDWGGGAGSFVSKQNWFLGEQTERVVIVISSKESNKETYNTTQRLTTTKCYLLICTIITKFQYISPIFQLSTFNSIPPPRDVFLCRRREGGWTLVILSQYIKNSDDKK
jgi:hypothetical protein